MKNISLIFLLFVIMACESEKKQVDAIFYNATVYSVNDSFETFEAFAIKDGKIIFIGSLSDVNDKYISSTKTDLGGSFVYPGFIDAHAHLYNLGMQLQQVNLVGSKSFQEVIQRINDFQEENNASYIIGRGWDQTKWEENEFPTNTLLDELFPTTPVALSRIDGHALLCNSLALERAGITSSTEIFGGEIQKKYGKLTGILIDNPMKLVFDSFPKPSIEWQTKALKEAEAICIKHGLTSLSDAGLDKQVIELIDSLQQASELSLRVYAMLSNTPENLDAYLDNPPYKTDRLNVRSVKVYSDGALGSRGAALKQAYSDHHDHFGSMLIGLEELQELAERIEKTDFQMNTHAIGDSANVSVLRTYASVLEGKKDQRWRVEHAQILDSADIGYFSTNILPSVQPTHATSDMYWAEDRLGADRIKFAYAYKSLLQQTGVLPLGTDFPVEEVNPLLTFYAAITRQDKDAWPSEGFQPQERLSREEALRGMTIWAAYSNFEEHEKGSLEADKFADFVVFEKDIMHVDALELLDLVPKEVYINGELQ
jgi:predicted amidohydrolase YtcJ